MSKGSCLVYVRYVIELEWIRLHLKPTNAYSQNPPVDSPLWCPMFGKNTAPVASWTPLWYITHDELPPRVPFQQTIQVPSLYHKYSTTLLRAGAHPHTCGAPFFLVCFAPCPQTSWVHHWWKYFSLVCISISMHFGICFDLWWYHPASYTPRANRPVWVSMTSWICLRQIHGWTHQSNRRSKEDSH